MRRRCVLTLFRIAQPSKPMPEPLTLTSVLLAGSYMVAEAAVKEATKDAYQRLKTAVGGVFGRRAVQAAEKLEAERTRAEGEAELVSLIPNVRDDEAAELAPALQAFL